MKIHIPDRHPRFGNAFGYSRWSDELRAALDQLGYHVEDADTANALVHVTPPHFFTPRANYLNVLFTAFEGEILPAAYRAPCKRADLVVVPSRHNLRVFNAAGISAFRCPLGVDAARFPFFERHVPRPDQKFRYLWVGAPNPRKGWPLLDRAWRPEFERDSEVELYVKTTSAAGSIDRAGNVIADSRCLSDQELAALYASAHCFVFPSYGEAFGLTLAEAMATGLPSIFTDYAGVRDFANRDNAYPVNARMIAVEYFGPNVMASIDPAALAAEMRTVQRNYSHALAKGRRAANSLARDFTWHKAALTLHSIVSARATHLSAA
ncbi:MAG TPA: glycosyltransferase family 4 protein [Candidatus Binataceae bacterium]|nr:glycosyltransferase family 4 protein [Candidatus Binataceae bacterium]